ncbi:AraC family transcriptional regulator [Derxia lacustris]|uniref:AraC family transcriptional regulator n=1 Tax=Derxia lacustris TaxID=764842 RepID=UPI000A176F36|nr:AraC family transcriptional regulator [Derxia lacustris]
MRPWLETVVMPADRSWLLFDRQLASFPFNWHYHPEFELTLTLGSEGMRFVGDHIARYGDGDLVLVGPNLPHAWESSRTVGAAPRHRAMVCWFTEAWIGALIEVSPELAPLRRLLDAAGSGLLFSPQARERAARQLLALVGAAPERHWLGLIETLLGLCADADRQTLATSAITPAGNSRERQRLAQVLDWLNAHYTEPVALEALAALAHVSPSQLQRLFKRSTRMSISAYVTQRRIGHACALLAQGALPVAQVGARVGYAEPGYFTRQFRAAKGCTPSGYRAVMAREIVGAG